MSFYDIVERDYQGNEVNFAVFRGKVCFGINVASRCGYTLSGYSLLSKLSKVEGVAVLLFPCNQFGGQEPGTDSEINAFCTGKGVEGANVFTKADVNGAETRPTYQFLREQGVIDNVSWNFKGKFIVDKEGNVSKVRDEATIEEDIAALVAK